LVIAVTAHFAWRILSPLGAIWHGDASRVPRMAKLRPQARTYLPFSLWNGALNGGLLLMGVDVFVDALGIWHRPRLLAMAAAGLFYAAGPLALLNVFAWAFNRPKVLIVPAYRDHPGWVRTTVWRTTARAQQVGARRRIPRKRRYAPDGNPAVARRGTNRGTKH
jgi:hypothetical protein